MKKSYYFLIVFLLSINIYAQGIAIQGIARDNTDAAITNESLSFDFRILDADDVSLYAETQQITTDNFGLFSHVVSTGTPSSSVTFNSIDFKKPNLKMLVYVNDNGTNIEVYNQELQYVPYAHYAKAATTAVKADNGVPPGTIVAFLGEDDKIPTGWVKCMGQDISSGDEYAALRAVVGSNLPDLRGRYLKGNGRGKIPVDAIDYTSNIAEYQDQVLLNHEHAIDINTNNGGAHGHRIKMLPLNDFDGQHRGNMQSLDKTAGSNEGWDTAPTDPSSGRKHTSTDGNHNHKIEGNTNSKGGKENRPWTVIVNYIIKL